MGRDENQASVFTYFLYSSIFMYICRQAWEWLISTIDCCSCYGYQPNYAGQWDPSFPKPAPYSWQQRVEGWWQDNVRVQSLDILVLLVNKLMGEIIYSRPRSWENANSIVILFHSNSCLSLSHRLLKYLFIRLLLDLPSHKTLLSLIQISICFICMRFISLQCD